MIWGESMSPSTFRGWYTSDTAGLALTPKVGGSLVETYIYTMKAPTAASEAAILTPIFDIDQNKSTQFPVNGWQKPNAPLLINGMAMEVLGSK